MISLTRRPKRLISNARRAEFPSQGQPRRRRSRRMRKRTRTSRTSLMPNLKINFKFSSRLSRSLILQAAAACWRSGSNGSGSSIRCCAGCGSQFFHAAVPEAFEEADGQSERSCNSTGLHVPAGQPQKPCLCQVQLKGVRHQPCQDWRVHLARRLDTAQDGWCGVGHHHPPTFPAAVRHLTQVQVHALSPSPDKLD